jgi:glycosyltransferase involved in cell wall biosynthesis
VPQQSTPLRTISGGLRQSRASRKQGIASVILIPAYKPSPEFPRLIGQLIELGAKRIVIVDDGSGPEYRHLFDAAAHRPEVQELRHAVNLGKGAALKTGINEILCWVPEIQTVVTADADGQHSPADILNVLNVAETNPGSLVMGARCFRDDVPLRSRVGNQITRLVVGLMIGHRLRDTQTGLRSIPRRLLPHLLRLNSHGYDFELDMLVALKNHGGDIIETPIETIYLDGNRSSHFNPLLDSMRIYFVLVRFAAISMLTALLDNSVFVAAYWMGLNLGLSQVAGRLAALGFNYMTVKKAVFFSDQKHRVAFLKYVALLVVSGFMSFGLIRFFVANLPIGVVPAKLLAETLLFFVNFVIERDFVFRKTPEES